MSTLTYLNFDVQLERVGDSYRVLVTSPTGETVRAAFEPPFSGLELENFLLRAGPSRRGVRRVDSQEVEAAKQFGERIFSALFSSEVRSALQSTLEEARRRTEAEHDRVGVRIRLRLTGAPELAVVPWEYIYNSTLNRFLALSVETPLVRYLDMPERIRPVLVTPPMRIVVVIASPRDYPQLDVQQEWDRLQSALSDLKQDGLVELELLEAPTLPALQRRLRRDTYHVLHFIGHGGYDHRTQDGLLVFEDEEQRARMVSGQDLGMLLHDHTSLRLAILNACEGARTGSDDPFAGVAQSLVQQGIPAVIAMQFEITDAAAITFAHEFYQAIADGYPVDASITEARKSMFAEARGNGLEWGTPVLYMRSPDGRIFDVQKRRVEAATRALEINGPEPVTIEPQTIAAVAPAPAETVPLVIAPIPEPEIVQASVQEPVPAGEPAGDKPVVRSTPAVVTVEEGKQVAPARKHFPLPLVAGVLLLLVLAVGAIWFFTRGVPPSSRAVQPPSTEAKSHFDAGMKAYDIQDYAGAMAEFGEAIKLQSDYLDAYYWRGLAYSAQGMYDEALAEFDVILGFKPDEANAYFEKGRIYGYKDDADNSIAQFTKAIDYDPKFVNAYLGRGEQYYGRGEYDLALEDFNTSVKYEPSTSLCYLDRGQVYYQQNKHDLAIVDLTKAIELYPEFVQAYSLRGDTYIATGAHSEAVADFRKVLELSQDEYWRSHAEEQLRTLGEKP